MASDLSAPTVRPAAADLSAVIGLLRDCGLEPAPRHQAPDVLHASDELRGACPAGATLMRREVGR